MIERKSKGAESLRAIHLVGASSGMEILVGWVKMAYEADSMGGGGVCVSVLVDRVGMRDVWIDVRRRYNGSRSGSFEGAYEDAIEI